MATPFTYQILTPEGPWRSGVCELILIPTSRGEIGVLANHQALLSDVLPGVMRVERQGVVERVSVGAGIFEVAGNAATLLVDQAHEG